MKALDLMTVAGAQEIRDKIRSYWREKGHYDVSCDVIDGIKSDIPHHPIAVVRSNLVNGLPPSKVSR